MRKFFTITLSVLAIMFVTSACKKNKETTLSDSELSANILKNATYIGTWYEPDGSKLFDVTVDFTMEDGVQMFALCDEFNMPISGKPTKEDCVAVGNWSVTDGNIKMVRYYMHGREEIGLSFEGKINNKANSISISTIQDGFDPNNYGTMELKVKTN